MDLKVDEH